MGWGLRFGSAVEGGGSGIGIGMGGDWGGVGELKRGFEGVERWSGDGGVGEVDGGDGDGGSGWGVCALRWHGMGALAFMRGRMLRE